MLSREIASACFLYFQVFVCNNFSQAFRPRATGPCVDVRSRACARVVLRSRSAGNLCKRKDFKLMQIQSGGNQTFVDFGVTLISMRPTVHNLTQRKFGICLNGILENRFELIM